MPAPTTASCPLCGPAAFQVWKRQGDWTVVQCVDCGLRYTWPQPAPAVTQALYASSAYYEDRSMDRPALGAWATRAQAILEMLSEKPVRVLDVGAGQGHLVHSLRGMGLSAEGVEPSPMGRKAARELYGLELWERIVECPQVRVDLITLIHSLEHARDPLGMLEELAPRLRPGGSLFVEVPNAGSAEMWLPARRREILDLPAHLYHFVPPTLSRVVERAGFRVTHVSLSNPSFVEAALAFGAKFRGPHGGELSATGEAAPGTAGAPRARRRLWAGRVLPWVRRSFPGWKFQLVATKPS